MKQFIIAAALTAAFATSAQSIPPRISQSAIEPYTGAARRAENAPAMAWMADGKSYAVLTDDGQKIIQRDIATGNDIATLMDVATTRQAKIDRIDDFTISPNGKMILVSTKTEQVYRRSKKANHWVYELHGRLLRPLSEEHEMQQSPVFAPDGLAIAFVADNNIHIKKLTYWTEVAVTKDGNPGEVINGIPDWVYEEEFTTTCSMTWTADSRMLCFLRYDETEVPYYNLQLYEGTCNPMTQYALYPGTWSYKYPVAGQSNSKVTLHSYDVDTRKTTEITLPDSRIEYIPRIEYANEQLMVVALNRDQTRMELFSVNPRSTVTKSVLVEEHSAWINPITYENITYEPDGIMLISGRSGYDHLYSYSYAGGLKQQLTSGDYDVTAYYGRNAATGAIYYQSTATGAINRVVSRRDAKGRVENISPESGMASASFNPGATWYTLTYSNATTPPSTKLYATSSAKARRTLVDNTTGEYAARYGNEPHREFFTMTSEGGVTLNGYMIKPADFDASRRYPVIMYQYSGPGSQEVLNQWSISWMTFAARQGYIVMCVDGRGTGGRGRKFMDVVYRNLGHYETIDQLAAARYAASLPYVDGKRIGLHGWSYGGYETLMASSAEGAPYAAAVAVAPVTDWRFYDTIYAERYMLTPGQNAEGYRESAPLWRTADVVCPLLIMHGTADDNVHPANTLQYLSQMESGFNYCDVLLFPNMNHSINGCGAQSLVYARMLDYFNRHLK